MASIMERITNVLGIDQVNMDGKLMVIEEQGHSNMSFLLSSVMFNSLKKNYKILLVLFHNTFHHYHRIGIKLGYNFTLQKEQGKINIIEPMKIITFAMNSLFEQMKNNMLHETLTAIKNEYYRMTKDKEPVIIIIDNLSHLCHLGYSPNECLYYERCLRSLVENNISQLCISIHSYNQNLESVNVNIFSAYLALSAHLFVTIESLKADSSDPLGTLTIRWMDDAIREKCNWPVVSRYMYKLTDRQVQIFAPDALT